MLELSTSYLHSMGIGGSGKTCSFNSVHDVIFNWSKSILWLVKFWIAKGERTDD